MKLSDAMALKSQLLLEASKSGLEFDSLLNESPPQVSNIMMRRQLDTFLRHQMFVERAGEPLYPKHHMMIHGILQQKRMGSLKSNHTYRDESLNAVIAGIARPVHRSKFDRTTHFKFDIMQRLGLRSAIT